MLANHHTHSVYSDGNSQPADYVAAAVAKGMDLLGFSEHSPLPFENPFSFKPERKQEYLAEMKRLKAQYAGKIELYTGMEIDYIPGMSENFGGIRDEYSLDYVIGSVHLIKPDDSEELWFTDGPDYSIYDRGVATLFGGDIRKAVTTYYRQINSMIQTQQFEILGHFDKVKMHNRGRFFSESDPWYTSLVNETIRLIAEKCLIVEVNTRGIYKQRSQTTYPGPEILKQLKALNVPVMLNSDAHQPHELDGAYTEGATILRQSGISETVFLKGTAWSTVKIEE